MTTTRQNGSLYTNITGSIATIVFGHLASNSFPSELLDRLVKEFDAISNNDAVAVIILKSEGVLNLTFTQNRHPVFYRYRSISVQRFHLQKSMLVRV